MTIRALAPMEMRAVAELPPGAGWQYEPKWDGFRCLAHRDGADVALVSKSGQPLARYFPEIVAAVQALADDRCSLDGELIVALDDVPSFDVLQQRIHPAASRVARLAVETPAVYVVFDLLRARGEELVGLPLRERRRRLERFAAAFPAGGTLRLSPATTDPQVVAEWLARGGTALDGVVAKRLDAAYAAGRRDAAVKVKQQRTADCVVGGYRVLAGKADRVGSLLLGLYDDAGLLDYIGFCSAFDDAERRALLERLAPYRGGTGFTGGAPDAAPSRWQRRDGRDRAYVPLAPKLVLEVEFDQVTGGRIRHGTRMLRWRTDKAPRQCTRDQLDVAGEVLGLLPSGTGLTARCGTHRTMT